MVRCLVALGFACLVGLMAQADGPSDEAKKLEGTWAVDSATIDGQAVEEMKGGRAVFAGDKLTLKGADGKETEKHTYKVNPSQKPKTMDFIPERQKKNSAPGKAIYELDVDTLKLCVSSPDRRPTEFTDKGQVLIILKRQK
jgi:uncharacterized protein (TIGR03067 family)